MLGRVGSEGAGSFPWLQCSPSAGCQIKTRPSRCAWYVAGNDNGSERSDCRAGHRPSRNQARNRGLPTGRRRRPVRCDPGARRKAPASAMQMGCLAKRRDHRSLLHIPSHPRWLPEDDLLGRGGRRDCRLLLRIGSLLLVADRPRVASPCAESEDVPDNQQPAPANQLGRRFRFRRYNSRPPRGRSSAGRAHAWQA